MFSSQIFLKSHENCSVTYCCVTRNKSAYGICLNLYHTLEYPRSSTNQMIDLKALSMILLYINNYTTISDSSAVLKSNMESHREMSTFPIAPAHKVRLTSAGFLTAEDIKHMKPSELSKGY